MLVGEQKPTIEESEMSDDVKTGRPAFPVPTERPNRLGDAR